MLNRKYIDSIRVHFPASYVRWSRRVSTQRNKLGLHRGTFFLDEKAAWTLWNSWKIRGMWTWDSKTRDLVQRLWWPPIKWKDQGNEFPGSILSIVTRSICQEFCYNIWKTLQRQDVHPIVFWGIFKMKVVLLSKGITFSSWNKTQAARKNYRRTQPNMPNHPGTAL